MKNPFKKLIFSVLGPIKFGKYISAVSRSAVYGRFCEKVYGHNLVQLNMADREQLEKLVSVLGSAKNLRLLDLGCGAGRISEYLGDALGAEVVGIDFASKPIREARVRTKENKKIQFEVMRMNRLRFDAQSFDMVISIDTLYFAGDLQKLIENAKTLLKPGGKMAFFFTSMLQEGKEKDQLLPENTSLGKALRANDLKFETWDFTESEYRVWKNTLATAELLKSDFAKEKSLWIYKSRIDEATKWLPPHENGQASRYLYFVQT